VCVPNVALTCTIFLVTCCSVLQIVAVICTVLQCVAACCSVLQCVGCSVLQCVVVICSVCNSDVLNGPQGCACPSIEFEFVSTNMGLDSSVPIESITQLVLKKTQTRKIRAQIFK